MTKFSYVDYATTLLDLIANDKIEADEATITLLSEKTNALLASSQNRAEYAAAHPRKPKGASPETLEKAESIKAILKDVPLTTDDINTALGANFTPLQVANLMKYIPDVKKTTIVRAKKNSKGLMTEKEYAGYYI